MSRDRRSKTPIATEGEIAADVLVWTRSRLDRRARVIASLPATVLREGRLLHAA